MSRFRAKKLGKGQCPACTTLVHPVEIPIMIKGEQLGSPIKAKHTTCRLLRVGFPARDLRSFPWARIAEAQSRSGCCVEGIDAVAVGKALMQLCFEGGALCQR